MPPVHLLKVSATPNLHYSFRLNYWLPDELFNPTFSLLNVSDMQFRQSSGGIKIQCLVLTYILTESYGAPQPHSTSLMATSRATASELSAHVSISIVYILTTSGFFC